MQRLTILWVLCAILAASQASAQNWAAAPPGDDSAGNAVAGEPTLAPTVSVELKAAAKDVVEGRRRGLTRKQKVAMGLTIRDMLRTLGEIHADGELRGSDNQTLAADILSRATVKNPQAFADANVGVDDEFWSRVIQWIEKMLPFLLVLLSFL